MILKVAEWKNMKAENKNNAALRKAQRRLAQQLQRATDLPHVHRERAGRERKRASDSEEALASELDSWLGLRE